MSSHYDPSEAVVTNEQNERLVAERQGYDVMGLMLIVGSMSLVWFVIGVLVGWWLL